jgi:hypothetical protein
MFHGKDLCVTDLLGRLFLYDELHLQGLTCFQESSALLLVRQVIGRQAQQVGGQKQEAIRYHLQPEEKISSLTKSKTIFKLYFSLTCNQLFI